MDGVFEIIQRTWHRKTWWSSVLLPLSLIYGLLVKLRALAYRVGIFSIVDVGVPVIVVGNLTVGGTGKTPLVMEIVLLLVREGYSPGVVTRGYKATARRFPHLVKTSSSPSAIGDEPLLIYEETSCPVVIDPDRSRGAQHLIRECGVDVIVSDDGLQHLRLSRSVEILVIDGDRRFGNRRLLPAGPLRESVARLTSVDLVVIHRGLTASGEYQMRTVLKDVVRLTTGERSDLARFTGKEVHVVAGIGNPKRFFSDLSEAGLEIIPHRFPDHHKYKMSDLAFLKSATVIMTSKDATKCRSIAGPDWWFAPQEIKLGESFNPSLLALLRRF